PRACRRAARRGCHTDPHPASQRMGAGHAGRAPGAALSRVPRTLQLCVADRHAAGNHRHPVQPAAGGRRLLPPVPGEPLAQGVQAACSRPPDLPAEEPRDPPRVPRSAAVNVAVVLLFRSFAIPPRHQHRVLFWGVLGAILLRGSLILAGVALVRTFHWVIAVFGAVLVYTAWKILFHEDEEDAQPADSAVVRWVAKKFPMT